MSKSTNAPFSWDQIEAQVRDAVLCQLSILEGFGPCDDELLRRYLGIDPDLLEADASVEERAAVLRSIPVKRHHLHALARCAYDYAYQLDGRDVMSETEHYEIVCGVFDGFPQTDKHGNPSPMSRDNDEPLRRVFETAVARWNLYSDDYDSGLSVRELALLSNMTVPAVRTSLSKEGFKLEASQVRGEPGRREDDKAAKLSAEDSLLWLSRRRGFVANRDVAVKPANELVGEIFADADQSFSQALRRAMIAQKVDPESLADQIGTSKAWIEQLSGGEVAEINIVSLRALARLFTLPEPEFVSRAVRHLLSLEAREQS